MTNTERARQYLAAIERGVPFSELTAFFADDVVQHEFPNQLVKNGARRGLKELGEGHARGAGIVNWQRYEIRNAIESGDWVALEVTWSASYKVPIGSIPPGGEMRANFGVFLQYRDGKIVRQNNYDCFDPF